MGRRRNRYDRQAADSTPPDADGQPRLDEDFLDALLGVGARLEAEPTEPVGVPIRDIMPDPLQPRRVMPNHLREAWLNGMPMEEVLHQWEVAAHTAAINAGVPLRWKHIIDQEDDLTALNESGPDHKEPPLPPVAEHWLDLVRLAGSIHQVGLEQPVTIYPDDGGGYRLIVGERRLLAFYLLDVQGFEGYTHIPAIKRPERHVWRQAFENGARQDLNAIGKARQLALLLMALNDGAWKPFRGKGQPGRAWYAQAADLRVPYGRAEAVTTVLGLKNPRHLRRYRALLTLPEEVWQLADEHDWTEGKLRSMVQAANNDPDQLVRIARIEAGLEVPPRAKRDPLTRSVERVIHRLEEVKAIEPNEDWTFQQREAVRRKIKEARQRLDEIERKL
ncbi:MAG: hypothetical protein Kow0077_29200 [Anaerolineae bacterium]